ncbi:hypothetical protein Tco_1269038 [Tanacetum coccineum]
MSFSTIFISSDTTDESIGSSASLVILSDTEIEVVTIHVVLPEVSLEAEAAVSEELSKDDAPEAAEPLPAQVVFAPPTVRPQPTLAHAFLAAIARWNAAPLSSVYPSFSLELSPSSSELSLSSSSEVSLSSSSETSSSSSETSSSSSGTSHTPSGSLPHRRHQVSSYSTPSSSVGTSHKRCRSPTTSLPTAASALEDATVETIAEPVIPPIHPEHTVEDRLEETEQELQTQRARVASSSEREITSLCARVRAVESS